MPTFQRYTALLNLPRIYAKLAWDNLAIIRQRQIMGKGFNAKLYSNRCCTPQPGRILYGFSRNPYPELYVDPMPEKEYYYSEDFGRTWKKREPPTNTKLCYGSTLQFIDSYRPMAIDPFDGNHVSSLRIR